LAININFKKMNIENPGLVSEANEDKKTKRKRLFQRVMAGISSAIAILMATNAFADGKAVKNKVIIDGKDKSQYTKSDAGIERPRNFGSAPEGDVVLGGNSGMVDKGIVSTDPTFDGPLPGSEVVMGPEGLNARIGASRIKE
jgi:hypothetical protein